MSIFFFQAEDGIRDIGVIRRVLFRSGLRRSWLDLLTTPAFAIINSSAKEEKFKLNYNFHDLNAKITHVFSDRSRLALSAYWGRDYLTSKDEWIGNDRNPEIGRASCRERV